MSTTHAKTFFIVFEGLDGSGKSEISRRVAALAADQFGEDDVLLTYEPHDPSVAGDYIRQVLRHDFKIASRTLALAYALNRADHNDRVISPFFDSAAAGTPRVCVCDRYYLSSLAYNVSPDLPIDAVMLINAGARRPDLTLFLDASIETCYQRMGNRGGERELFESKLDEKLARYRRAMEYVTDRGDLLEIVDANGTLLEVLNATIRTINAYAPDWFRLPEQVTV